MAKSLSLAKSLSWLLLLLLPCFSFGQNQTVTGTIKDPDKKTPLVGVTVKVEGSNTVAQTDEKGKFTIKAAQGQTIVISHIGFATQKIKVTGSTIDVDLKAEAAQQDEVVVVAMDIKRKPRELGYSVQTIAGKDVQETQRQNFINGLQGRAAGLTVTPTTGLAGASSSIVLRGFNSMSLNNSPLFVVDGIILDNHTVDENSSLTSSIATNNANRMNDYTNRIADLNPADIESITILKGPEATALYGSQASSGAIVITTKKAKPNQLEVNYNNSFRASKITRFVKTNNEYGPGSNGIVPVPSSVGLPSGSFTYFGPAYPSDTKMYDNTHHFFQTGFAQTQNVSVDFGTKNSSYRASGSYYTENGVVPNNNFTKESFRISNTTKVGKYIDFSPSISFTGSANNKPLKGAGGYILDLLLWPGDNDMRNYQDGAGNKRLLYTAAYNSEPDNPLWNVYHNTSQDIVARWVATLGVNINPYPWLSIAGRFGFDTYKANGYMFYHPESYVLSAATGGSLDNYWRKYNGYNHTITATGRKTMGDFTGRLMVGTMWQDYETSTYAVSGTGSVDSVRKDSSSTLPASRLRLSRSIYGQWNQSIIREIAYFAEASIGYKNVVFLSYSHRFETASTLPSQNRNYNYPAGSLSVIVSDIFPGIKGKVLNYAKLRTSLASTARLNDPYSNQSAFVFNYASSPSQAYSYGYTNNNPTLTPERQHTYEVGGEFKFFNNLISIDAAYYNTLCLNQIVQNFRASYATGFVLNTQNAASLRNQGVELSIDVNPIRKKDFSWNIHFNFNKMWSKVLTLPAPLDPMVGYYNADTWLYGNARGGILLNQSTSVISAYGYQRNNAGQVLIDPTSGLPLIDANFRVRGDRNPAFTLGTINNLRYKNWTLSFLWDLKVGGDIFNGTDEYLTIQGKSIRTGDRKVARVVNGVLNDGMQNSAAPTKNTIAITPYYQNTYYTSMPEEEFIQRKVNWFRLKDITLSYMFSDKTMKNIKWIKALSVFATGTDLVLLTNYRGADPAVSSTTAGTTGVGAFGFDYSTLPLPAALNVGLRANF